MKLIKKSMQPALDHEVVCQMLETIFEECGREPNTVPVEVLASYRNYRRERYAFQKVVLVIILLLFFMLPMLFMTPVCSISDSDVSEKGQPIYHVSVNTFLPISRVTATIEGRNVPVYETGNCAFSIEPTLNGKMTVTVTLANKQYTVEEVMVNAVDRDPPQLTSNRKDKNFIYLYFSDADSGIDYENISIKNLDGEELDIASYNEETGCVKLAYPKESLNIFVPDVCGNQLQLVLTMK